jgi:hypothetical protein
MTRRRFGLSGIILVTLMSLAPVARAGDATTGWIIPWWQVYGGTYADAQARIITNSNSTAYGYWRRNGGINTIDYFAISVSVQLNGVTQGSATCDRTTTFQTNQATATCTKAVVHSSGSWRSRTFACADDNLFSFRCSYDYVGHLYSPSVP